MYDQALAFDYDGSGKLDHLALYRPGHGIIYILTKRLMHECPADPDLVDKTGTWGKLLMGIV